MRLSIGGAGGEIWHFRFAAVYLRRKAKTSRIATDKRGYRAAIWRPQPLPALTELRQNPLRRKTLPGYPPEMARRPAWHHRLAAEIPPAARRFPAPELNRVDPRTLFQTAERDAYRLLRRLGARAAGDTLLVSRDVLVARLEKIRQSRDYRAFRAKRGAVGRAVAAEAGQGREDSPSHPKRHRIHGTVNFVPRPKLANLPPGVTLERGG